MVDFLDTKEIKGDVNFVCYDYIQIQFDWQSADNRDSESGLFLMMNMACYDGAVYESKMRLQAYRRHYGAEIIASLLLADINQYRDKVIDRVQRFIEDKPKLWDSLKDKRKPKNESKKQKVDIKESSSKDTGKDAGKDEESLGEKKDLKGKGKPASRKDAGKEKELKGKGKATSRKDIGKEEENRAEIKEVKRKGKAASDVDVLEPVRTLKPYGGPPRERYFFFSETLRVLNNLFVQNLSRHQATLLSCLTTFVLENVFILIK